MPELTAAELAEGLAKGEAAGWNLSNSESRRSEYLRCWFNDHGETALKELAALREQVAWRPIETAPLSGKWILLWWPAVTDAPFVGYFDRCWKMSDGSSWKLPEPTHWQPLPEPPKEQA